MPCGPGGGGSLGDGVGDLGDSGMSLGDGVGESELTGCLSAGVGDAVEDGDGVTAFVGVVLGLRGVPMPNREVGVGGMYLACRNLVLFAPNSFPFCVVAVGSLLFRVLCIN